MKLLCLLLVSLLTVANTELIAMLHGLHQWHGFPYLTTEEQVLATEMLAAAELCKLTAFIQQVGRAKVEQLIVHLPAQDETQAQRALLDYLHKEQAGQCHIA